MGAAFVAAGFVIVFGADTTGAGFVAEALLFDYCCGKAPSSRPANIPAIPPMPLYLFTGLAVAAGHAFGTKTL